MQDVWCGKCVFEEVEWVWGGLGIWEGVASGKAESRVNVCVR